MRQVYDGTEYDTAAVLETVQAALGIKGYKESEIKETFRKAHRWLQARDPSHRFGFRTIDADFADYLGRGIMPACVIEFFRHQVAALQ